jgi:chaperone BCS1
MTGLDNYRLVDYAGRPASSAMTMQSFIHEAVNLFRHNEVASGGLVLGGIGAVVAYARSLPMQLVRLLERHIFVTLRITNDTRLYDLFQIWLSRQEQSQKARLLLAAMRSEANRVHVTPAPGYHVLSINGRRVWMEIASENKESRVVERVTLTMLGRTQAVFRDLIAQLEAIGEEEGVDSGRVYRWSGYRWVSEPFVPRSIGSVVLPDTVTTALLQDLERFSRNREWYGSVGIPYRRGYLLHGPPGTGKSSLVSALAGHLRRRLYVLNLNSVALSTNGLCDAMGELGPNAIVLLEDVDVACADVGTMQASKLTFAELLNALDGVSAHQGHVVFLTTNHVERLDPALIRPGRIDIRVELGYATGEQAARLFRRFFPDASCDLMFAAKVEGQSYTMAELQGHLIVHRDCEVSALRSEIAHADTNERPPPKRPKPNLRKALRRRFFRLYAARRGPFRRHTSPRDGNAEAKRRVRCRWR